MEIFKIYIFKKSAITLDPHKTTETAYIYIYIYRNYMVNIYTEITFKT